jgi:hypothetical protein
MLSVVLRPAVEAQERSRAAYEAGPRVHAERDQLIPKAQILERLVVDLVLLELDAVANRQAHARPRPQGAAAAAEEVARDGGPRAVGVQPVQRLGRVP